MPRPYGSDDIDQLFIDILIALAEDIVEAAERTKYESDDPPVLYDALKQQAAALLIQQQARQYRPRLVALKKLALQQANGDLRSLPGSTPKKRPPRKAGRPG